MFDLISSHNTSECSAPRMIYDMIAMVEAADIIDVGFYSPQHNKNWLTGMASAT